MSYGTCWRITAPHWWTGALSRKGDRRSSGGRQQQTNSSNRGQNKTTRPRGHGSMKRWDVGGCHAPTATATATTARKAAGEMAAPCGVQGAVSGTDGQHRVSALMGATSASLTPKRKGRTATTARYNALVATGGHRAQGYGHTTTAEGSERGLVRVRAGHKDGDTPRHRQGCPRLDGGRLAWGGRQPWRRTASGWGWPPTPPRRATPGRKRGPR